MAVRRISTEIILDGEQQFKRAMSEASREMRVQAAAMNELSAAYQSNGDKQAYLTGRQNILKTQIAQQEEMVRALEERLTMKRNDPNSSVKSIQNLEIEVSNARAKLLTLNKSLTSTDREVEELGRDAIKAGRQIEEGIGDGAREAENELTDLMSTMQDSLSAIQSNTAVTAIKTVWDMASGAYSAVDGFVSGTVDYRRQLSFLELNADENGFDFSDIKTKLVEVTTITGDASSSIETLSNIMAVPGIDPNTMTRAIEELGGAVISFPETMKFESLADSLQETLATGEATGQFAELLGRMGIDIEEFNGALEKSPTAAGDLEVALAYLAEGGLNDVYSKWHETNGEMSDAMKTQAMIEDERAEFAGTLEKYVTTPTKKAFLGALTYANDLIKEVEENGIGSAAQMVKEDLDKAMESGVIPSIDDVKKKAYQFSPAGVASGILEKIGLEEGADAIKDASSAIWKPLSVSWWKNVFDGEDNAEATEAGAEAAKDFTAGFEETLDTSTWGEGKEAEPVLKFQRQMHDMLPNIYRDKTFLRDMEGAGEEGGAALIEGLEGGTAGADGAAKERGAAFAAAYAAGIMSQVSYVGAAAGALAAAAAARAAAAAIPSPAGVGGINLAMNIDGKTFARVTAPYMSGELAVNPS